jgi:hypothetical protein
MNGRHLLSWKMESFIMVSGKMEKEMVGVSKFGKMELFMRVIGKMIWQMDKED